MLRLLEKSTLGRAHNISGPSVHAWGCSFWAGLLEQTKTKQTRTHKTTQKTTNTQSNGLQNWFCYEILCRFLSLDLSKLPLLYKVSYLEPHTGSEFLKGLTLAGKVLTTQLWINKMFPLSLACPAPCPLLVQLIPHWQGTYCSTLPSTVTFLQTRFSSSASISSLSLESRKFEQMASQFVDS